MSYENIKIPKIPMSATHRLINNSPFYDASYGEVLGNVSENFSVLLSGSEVIALEDSVGYQQKWLRVLIKDESDQFTIKGCILQDRVEQIITNIRGTSIQQKKPFIRVNKLSQYQPNKLSVDINWRSEKPNVMYRDIKRGMYCIAYDTGYEVIPVQGIDYLVETSLIKGLSIILKSLGKIHDEKYVKKLQKKYYFFGAAESVDFDLRNCSTFRVLVSIPMRYAESEEIKNAAISFFDGFVGLTPFDKSDEDPSSIEGINPEDQPPREYLHLVFDNYFEYDSFFKKLFDFPQTAFNGLITNVNADTQNFNLLNNTISGSNQLKEGTPQILAPILNACDRIYSNRIWDITPDLYIDFKQIINNVRLFKEKTNFLIFSNIAVTDISSSIRGFRELDPYLKDAKKKSANIATILRKYNIYSAFEAITVMRKNFDGIEWNGKLDIKIDEENIKLLSVKFINSSGREIPLCRDVLNYLNDESILNSTSLNYIIKCYQQKDNKESTFFDVAKQNRTKFLIDSAAGAKKTVPDKRLPDVVLSDFVKEYHYPKITEMIARPAQITDCATETAQLIKDIYNSKTRDATSVWAAALTLDVKNQKKYEGDFLTRTVNGVSNDTNLRILLGKDPETEQLMKQDPIEAIRTKYFPALQEMNINGILAELIKCSTGNISFDEFAALLEKFNVAKEFIEQLLFSTLCNPFLSSVLKKINAIQLPVLEILDPNASLAQQLEQYFAQALMDILLASLREIIKALMKNCMSDQNREQQPEGASNLGDDIANALENPENGAEIDDMLDDVFGQADSGTPQQGNGLFDYPSNPSNQSRDRAKNLIDDFSCLLTTNEICRLLNGSLVSDDIYNSLIEVVRRKYPKILSRNKLSTPEDIKRFFAIIGKNIDLSVCNIVLQRPDIVDCGCSDNLKDAAKKAILAGKGLDDGLIDDILNDIKKQEKKNIEDVLDYINKSLSQDDPINYMDVPPALCKRSASGDLIPPAVSMAPSIQSFKGLIDNMFKSVYDSFDSEAAEWSKTSYSVKTYRSQMMSFDEKAGKISTNPPKVDEDAEYDEDNHPVIGSTDQTKEIIPAYLFSEIVENNKYQTSNKNGEYNFSVFIDGNKQEKLDANLITEPLLQRIKSANTNLKSFIRLLLSNANDAINILNIQGAYTYDAESGQINTFWKDAQDIFKFISVLDSFLRDSPASRETHEYKELLNSLGVSSEQLSLFLSNSGAPLYMKIMSFLREKKAQIYSLADKISSVMDPSTNRVREKAIIDSYENNIKIFDSVEKIYKIVFNSTINYPEFEFDFYENYQPYSSIQVNNGQLYDKYKVQINKNNSPFIVFEDVKTYDDSIKKFIENNLSMSHDNPSKEEVYNKFINYMSNTRSSTKAPSYKEVSDFLIKSIFNSLKNPSGTDPTNNPFLGKIKVANKKSIKKKSLTKIGDDDPFLKTHIEVVPESWKSLTDYLALVLPDRPTPQEKSCGVRPHYLDIDNIKNDAVDQKSSNLCVEEITNDKVRNDESVDTDELQQLERNDTQNILILATHTLTLRVYLHDLILRSISLFGYYDPQILRDSDLLLEFLTNSVESEMRGIDNTYYDLLTIYILENVVKDQVPYTGQPTNKDKRKALKALVDEELKKAVLPKLAKRIVDDTYDVYSKTRTKSSIKLPNISFDLKKYNSLSTLISCLKISKEITQEKDGVYLNINSKKIKLFNGAINQYLDSSTEFKFLFEYLFPIKRYISCVFITNNLCTSTRRQILNTFIGTKSSLRNLSKILYSNGQPITPNANNPQDLANNESQDSLASFILKALVTTPIQIAKGFIEVVDPTVAISSNIYKAGKAADPDLSDTTNPAIGMPIAVAATIASFWVPAFIPFSLNSLNALYYSSGLWSESVIEEGGSDRKKKKMAENLLNDLGNMQDCEAISNHKDKLRFDKKDEYVIINRYENKK